MSHALRQTRPGAGCFVLAALGAAGGVAALSWAGEGATLAVVPVAVAAVVVLVPSLRKLLPRGTLRARRGVASAVLCRGLIAGSFFAANAYLPLISPSCTPGRWSAPARC